MARLRRLPPRDLGKAYCNVFAETATLEVVAGRAAPAACDAHGEATRSADGHPAPPDGVIDLSTADEDSTPLRRPADKLSAAKQLLVGAAGVPARDGTCSHRQQEGQVSGMAMVALVILAGLGVLTVVVLAAGLVVLVGGRIGL